LTVQVAGVVLATFALVFAAELPDKTAIASLILGTKYRPLWVFAGVAAAFAVHVVLAVFIGNLLGLLPHRLLQATVGTLFALGAVLLLRGRREEEPVEDVETIPTFWRVAGTGFMVILVAEFGDLTQFVTANLAAHYRSPVAVGVGALAGLLSVAGLAISGGRALMRVLPLTWITRVAALAMLILSGFSLASAIR
jgi:putative Ca2+/H+ antiporter (TMEM165/GDT1 family)